LSLSDHFEQLASDLESRLGSESLPTAAAAALQSFLATNPITPSDVLTWVANATTLPRQEDLEASFGEPPITVLNRPEFYIQVLFWRDGTTRIHQHAFSGAFAVLSGSSIHVTYSFAPEIVVSEHFMTGRLQHENTEYLRTGDCREIVGGTEFIHSVFHLDSPTVSIVVRNHSDQNATTQLAYSPTVALDLFERSADYVRKRQVLDLVCEEENADELLAAMIASSSLCSSYLLLEQVARRRGRIGAISELLAHAQSVHGNVVQAFAESLTEMLRVENIVERRKAIRNPEHRRILALLLTVPNRQTILALLTTIEPSPDPVSTLVQALREMRSLPAPSQWGPNALGLDLDDDALAFIERVLRGASVDAAAELCEDPLRGQMLALQLPLASILKPLFRAS
tara:strand:+ start:21887 stop:23080 length:1194 start_codon:yes stop_codon:yes gene_type:complete